MLKLYLSPKLRHAVLSRHGLFRFLGLDKFFASIFLLSMPILNRKTTLKTPISSSSMYKQTGFSLLELLLVISLLGIVAIASMSLLIDDGDWKRQENVEVNWGLIRKAIVNDVGENANGSVGITGFVADMGRLPNCLRELVMPRDCSNADNNLAIRLPLYQHDIDSQVSAGWRGPYLSVAGANQFRDGWGNEGTDDGSPNDDRFNYGWVFGLGVPDNTACENANALAAQTRAGELFVQSCGMNRRINSTDREYSADYPANINGAITPVVTNSDYTVSLGSAWAQLPIKFSSSTLGASINIPANSLRVRLNYPFTSQPISGVLPDWGDALLDTAAERNVSPFLSALFPANLTKLPDSMNRLIFTGSVTVPVGSSFNPTTNLLTVPNGDLIFTDGSRTTLQNCPCDLIFNPGANFVALPTVSGVTEIRLQPQHISPLIANLGKRILVVPTDSIVTSTTQIDLPNGATLTFNAPIANATTVEEVEANLPNLILGDVVGGSTVTVSEAFTMNGNTVETNTSGDNFIVADFSTVAVNVITVEPTTPFIPVGQRSITVVCEADGLNYDGDCANNADPNGYVPIAIPYRLSVTPRATPTLPNSIPWNLP